jgi:hypothetical protein
MRSTMPLKNTLPFIGITKQILYPCTFRIFTPPDNAEQTSKKKIKDFLKNFLVGHLPYIVLLLHLQVEFF